ncbi:MAG: hypothetical protein ACE5NM_10050 [Sedimentisphaerales bacterium]
MSKSNKTYSVFLNPAQTCADKTLVSILDAGYLILDEHREPRFNRYVH